MKGLRKYQPLIVCIATILFFSCSSTKNGFVVDKNNPPDQNATILFQNSYIFINNDVKKHTDIYFYLKKWNNVDIEKYFSRAGGTLIVPAGNNTITFNVSYLRYDHRNCFFKNDELQYDFEPGKKYRVNNEIGFAYNESNFLRSGYEYNIELYIRLYDITEGELKPVFLKRWTITRLWFPTAGFYYP